MKVRLTSLVSINYHRFDFVYTGNTIERETVATILIETTENNFTFRDGEGIKTLWKCKH